jgi:hypothetical protein
VPEFCQELSYGYVAFDVNNVIRWLLAEKWLFIDFADVICCWRTSGSNSLLMYVLYVVCTKIQGHKVKGPKNYLEVNKFENDSSL